MENLIKTDNPKNYNGGTIPAIDNGVLITTDKGKFKTSQTLPDEVQENIDVEKISFSDSTVNNSSETKHGLLPKLSGEDDEFLNGNGEFVKPPRTGSGFGNIWNVESGQTVTIGANYENVVSGMVIDGSLIIYGKLTIL